MSFWLPATCAAPSTPLTLVILTHTMVLQAIRRTIWILTAGNNDPPPADPSARPQANQDGPARAWRPEGAANTTHRNSNVAAIAPRAPVRSVDRITVTSNSYGVGHFHDGEGSSPSEPARNRMRRFGRKCRKRCKDCARCRRLRASAKSRPVVTVRFLARRIRF